MKNKEKEKEEEKERRNQDITLAHELLCMKLRTSASEPNALPAAPGRTWASEVPFS